MRIASATLVVAIVADHVNGAHKNYNKHCTDLKEEYMTSKIWTT